MADDLVSIITAEDPAQRDRSLESYAAERTLEGLVEECAALDRFRRESANLYHRVRALFFLYALHRFHLPALRGLQPRGWIPYPATRALFERRFDEAIDGYLARLAAAGPDDALSSALAQAYHGLAFQTLADQVRRSVRSVEGNGWMFAVERAADQPLRLRPELLADGAWLRERTPVRMDLTHSAWSDIFFLGMDFPEGARVINTSIDLGVWGRDEAPEPPIECRLRVLHRPVLRLESIDLRARVELAELSEVFDFARDYLGLLKAALIAAGWVPPSLEGSGEPLSALLERVVGEGRGLELTCWVRGIPKGSRLAVSTNLLASLIAVLMRATGQTAKLAGPLAEPERRLVAARAILGEWLAGSGGGWQDSGGLWPGLKLIGGERAREGDPEFGISRGRLLPSHQLLGEPELAPGVLENLQRSLVLVHGGMAQDVGPVLEMVTEKYLLRSEVEWAARREALGVLDEVLAALRSGDIRAIGAATTRNFEGPIRAIIPWATNLFTERLIEHCRAVFGEDFWGFWMLGGMAGGGMGFLFAPERRDEGRDSLAEQMRATKRELEHGVPFAMDPVVYEFAVNETGSAAELVADGEACAQPAGQPAETVEPRSERELTELLAENGFDREVHEEIRRDLQSGVIGLARNRLAGHTAIEEVRASDVIVTTDEDAYTYEEIGRAALRRGEVAVITLAAGSGSRWTQGAGVVKALFPFARLAGQQRSFLEVHLAKSRRTSRFFGAPLPHVFTTSYLTHGPIAEHLERRERYGYGGPLRLSRGRSVGLRLVPMARDLHFAWEELARQRLDEQAEKVRASLEAALIDWARGEGEGSDYTDNLPANCLHPVGHWYEVPNLLLNGTLVELLAERPALRWLMLHNIDTLGADVDPSVLGRHVSDGTCLSFEVLPRRIDDSGGGLARIEGRARLVEGPALPREEDEWRLSWYSSMTTWIDLDQLLEVFGLSRDELGDAARVAHAVRRLARRMPTYVTLKDVKKRWGLGQEDVFPVAQFEQLWGDMSSLPEVDARYFAVPRRRGQQLKDPAQLDGWLRDGSAKHVESLCDF